MSGTLNGASESRKPFVDDAKDDNARRVPCPVSIEASVCARKELAEAEQ